VNTDTQKVPDEVAFLSPAETRGILSALEERDARMLGSPKQPVAQPDEDEEGFFVSPEDLEESGVEVEIPLSKPERREHAPTTPSVQSDILTRIAGELRSIKSELGSLKSNYDEMMANSEPAEEREWEEAPETRKDLPDELQDDLKRLLVYLDRLLESLPEAKIDEFAGSEYFDLYRKIFDHFDLS
jgi:hypothetical protein